MSTPRFAAASRLESEARSCPRASARFRACPCRWSSRALRTCRAHYKSNFITVSWYKIECIYKGNGS